MFVIPSGRISLRYPVESDAAVRDTRLTGPRPSEWLIRTGPHPAGLQSTLGSAGVPWLGPGLGRGASLAGVSETLALLGELAAWQQLLLVLAVAVGAAKLVNVVSSLLVRRVARLSERGLDDVVVEELRLPLYATVFLGAVYLSAGLVADLPLVSDPIPVLAKRLAVTGIVLAWTYGAIQTGRRGMEVVRERGTPDEFAPILKNIWTFAVVLFAFITFIGV